MKGQVILALVFVLVAGIVALVVELSRLESRVHSLENQTNYLQNYIEPSDYSSSEITVLVKTGRGLYYQRFEDYNQVLSFITGLKSTGKFLENTIDSK